MTGDRGPYYFKKAFDLAALAGNRVHPNPCVGAVVVKNGKIIGKGFHAVCGENHAEINALLEAGEMAKDSDLYVTLEPCSTHGKTPPCTDAIIRYGIKRVFFGARDPNPKNQNKAIAVLKDKNIETVFVDYQTQQDSLNRPFIWGLKNPIPYIQIKAGISLDGKICDKDGRSQWITSEASRTFVQSIRKHCDAIAVGANTFNTDNPSLKIRLPEDSGFKDPAKIIFSSSGSLNLKHSLLLKPTEGEVIVMTTQRGIEVLEGRIKNPNCHLLLCEKGGLFSLKRGLTSLKKRGYHNLLLEGGGRITGHFLKNKFFHEIHLFVAPVLLGHSQYGWSGISPLWGIRDKRFLKPMETKQFENDIYLRYQTCLQESSSL